MRKYADTLSRDIYLLRAQLFIYLVCDRLQIPRTGPDLAEYFEGDRSFGSKWRRYLERKTAPSVDSYQLILEIADKQKELKAELQSFYESPFWHALNFKDAPHTEEDRCIEFYKTLPAKLQSHIFRNTEGRYGAEVIAHPLQARSLEAIADVANLDALAAFIVLTLQEKTKGFRINHNVKLRLFNLLLLTIRSLSLIHI